MPTSATGRSIAECARRPPRCGPAAGFTLVEMLVALVIVAVLAGFVMFAVPDASRGFRFEADRLARLMSLAKEEAVLRAAPLRLEADLNHYRFLVWRDRRWQPIEDDPALRERAWAAPTQLSVQRPDGLAVIEFGREQVDVPFRVGLSRQGLQASIVANGLGAYTLE